MPIVDHNNAPEVPWRPNYRKWLITQEGDGTTSTDAAISEVGVGTGAPLHTHEDDEPLCGADIPSSSPTPLRRTPRRSAQTTSIV